jgi:hypothetical protein
MVFLGRRSDFFEWVPSGMSFAHLRNNSAAA